MTRPTRSSRLLLSRPTPPKSVRSANLSRPLRTGTERPASRPREGREGEGSTLLSDIDHRSSASGGLFSAPDEVAVAELPVPIDSVVDPRIGAHGRALLTFEDGS